MKIEIGENMMMSWMRHAKSCQLVQTNWKPSSTWQLLHEEDLQKMMDCTSKHFQDRYGYAVFKGSASLGQVIQQAEIDVLGVSYELGGRDIYAVDIAFHEAGLNYGTKDETVMRVVKKWLRTAMCVYGYFDSKSAEVIFASPKINQATLDILLPCLNDTQSVLNDLGFEFSVRLLCNNDFEEKIIQPVTAATAFVADTSELYIRSIQMSNLFAGKARTFNQLPRTRKVTDQTTSVNSSEKNHDGFKGLQEMKIGALVRSVLTLMLKNNIVPPDELQLMQTDQFSKKTFHINYPLLRKTSLSNGQKVLRYWADAVESFGEEYFICSEWFETAANNDRPYFMQWLSTKGETLEQILGQ